MRTGCGPIVVGSSTTMSACQPVSMRPRSVIPYSRAGTSVSMWIASSIGQHLPLAHRFAEHRGRVVERREEVEVGAGVGRADDGAAVAPDLHARLPVLVLLGAAREPEAGHEIVGHDDVEQRVERVLALLLRDVADTASLELLVLGRERLVDDVDRPVRDADETLALARRLTSAARPSVLASIAFFSSCGSVIGFCHPGIVSSRKPLSKQMRGDGASGSVSARTVAPRSRRVVGRGEVVLGHRPSLAADTNRTFQFSGRSAASDMRVIRSAA